MSLAHDMSGIMIWATSTQVLEPLKNPFGSKVSVGVFWCGDSGRGGGGRNVTPIS